MPNTLNISEHATSDVCPRCERNTLDHVHCGNTGCTFCITVCSACDKRQAVEAFMQDHLKDCYPRPFVRLPVEVRAA